MRAVAEQIMRGRMQASLIITLMMLLSLMIPGLFWLGAIAASLVLLRKGVNPALQASLVGFVIALLISGYFGQPMPLLALVGSLLMAQTLRVTVSWVETLLVNALFSFVCIIWFYINPTLAMQRELQVFVAQTQAELVTLLQQSFQLTQEQLALITGFLPPLMISVIFVLVIQVFCIISVVVARYLQALLYNPGGFKQEFYSLRMPLKVTIGLCLAMFVLPGIYYVLVVLFFVCSIPLAFTGLSVVHGLSAKMKLPSFSLGVFYVLFFLAYVVVYPLLVLLAIIDSAFNLRKLDTVKTV